MESKKKKKKETGLGKLNLSDQMVVEALRELGDGEQSVQVGRKQKCECCFSHGTVAEKRSR
jgi:hypothetical protein